MKHDGVEQEIEVPEVSVRHHERAGWVVVDGQPHTAAAATGRRREGDES
ncbi:hypothetical protein [Streptomyces sp. NPDC006997]